jgi:hypothetical protein
VAVLLNDRYNVLLTVDQGIPHEQNRSAQRLSIIVIQSRTNQPEDLLPLVDDIMRVLETIQPGQTVAVS